MKQEYAQQMDLFEKTKKYEENGYEKSRKSIEEDFRMSYHLMPPVGWMNDPNGLCVFNGVYHVFFQYTPGDASGDDYRGWGHYSSADMLSWKYEGLALAPDTVFDKDGAYSGSALIDDGKMYLYYTGNVKEPGDYDYILEGRGANVLLVVSDDGYPCGKEEKHLLLTNGDYPADCSCHVRDPKVWMEDGVYYMLLGARTIDDKGKALIYRSSDKINWMLYEEITYTGGEEGGESSFGYMWECPDLFKVSGRTWFSFSPQGLEAQEYKYQNKYQAGYFEVKGDIKEEYTLEAFREWDMGFDFYAPQTFEDAKGRRILLAWVGMPDAEYGNLTLENGWQHCLTIPREITVKEGRLCQSPVEELQQLRGRKQVISSYETHRTGGAYELLVSCGKGYSRSMTIHISDGVFLQYDGDGELQLMLTDEAGAGRNIRKALISELKNVRMFVDFSVIEIFINDGEITLTTRFYPKKHTLRIEAEDTVNQIWELEKR